MKKIELGILALLPAALAFAQTEAPKKDLPLPPISESVTVAVTDVEVVVTDSKGRRVPGLKKEDFQVFEDDVPQPITNFYAVSGGRALLPDGTQIALTGEEAKAPEAVPASLKAKYVLYVDNLNIDPLHRNRMFRSLRDFVDKTIGANAEAMVVTFNRSLKVRQKLTSDRGLVQGTLDDIEREAAQGITIVSERNEALQKINDSQSEAEAIAIAREKAREMDYDLQLSVEALKNTIAGLAGVEGRKILLYLSDGLPQAVGQELFETIQKKFQSPSAMAEALSFDRTASYAGIIQSANSEGVTIYPLDAAGLQVEQGVTAESASMQSRPSTFLLEQNLQMPLQTLARETGGIAAVNTNDARRELDEIAQDFSDFYSIGYRSSRGGVDRPHRIEVRVNKSGLRVRYRAGYLEKTIETRTAEAVTAALYYARSDNPMKLGVAVGKPRAYGAENYLVPVKISIPIDSVTLVPEGPDYHGRLYVYFVVLDSEGKQSDLQIRPLDIKVAGKSFDSARKKDYGYDVQLIMIPGGQKLSVAVRDGVSGAVSYVQKSVFVSVLPDAQPEKKSEATKN